MGPQFPSQYRIRTDGPNGGAELAEHSFSSSSSLDSSEEHRDQYTLIKNRWVVVCKLIATGLEEQFLGFSLDAGNLIMLLNYFLGKYHFSKLYYSKLPVPSSVIPLVAHL